MRPSKKTILFVAENVTLAQVVRLVTLASRLDRERYHVAFACSRFDPLIFAPHDFEQHVLPTVDPHAMFRALQRGQRPYDKRTLARYVDSELALLQRVQPDLVVSDLRWSLAVSAKVAGVPHAALINAYFSPFAVRSRFPLPDHPIVSLVGEELAAAHFEKALPFVFRWFAQPLNALRARYGLPAVGDLLELLTYGDYVLYPDTPGVAPTSGVPSHHHYLGPVPWSPALPLPPEVEALPSDRPLVYMTLGSSGQLSLLPAMLESLGRVDAQFVLATAGRVRPKRLPSNVLAVDFVPGDLVARRAQLVITNGGSSTGYQALAEGVPVLGIPSNLDQLLCMQALQDAGCGRMLRNRELRDHGLASAIEGLLADGALHARARAVAAELRSWDSAARFEQIVERAVHDADATVRSAAG